ncbi:hypothetical protein TWF569_011703 [Orbilia oligospora]|nr:hypothetical protein TWF706_003648 [Orbilia oligospora]KAF3087570.1 hypothetical protein TWF103_001392 [Orbilia oligospora]KAF3127554.1 hypothetical protein TWF569_011703 [Orbilia oligospora]
MEYGEGSFPTYLWNPGSGSINLKVDNFEASIINLPLNSVMRSELIPGFVSPISSRGWFGWRLSSKEKLQAGSNIQLYRILYSTRFLFLLQHATGQERIGTLSTRTIVHVFLQIWRVEDGLHRRIAPFMHSVHRKIVDPEYAGCSRSAQGMYIPPRRKKYS